MVRYYRPKVSKVRVRQRRVFLGGKFETTLARFPSQTAPHSLAHSQFYTLFVSIIIALNGGASYCFSLWSPLLKSRGYDQHDLAKLGAAHTGFGAYSSFIAGLLYDSLERRQHVGPRLTLLIGCILSSVGFSSLYLAVTSSSPDPPSLPLLLFLAVLAGNGCTWFDVSPMSTNLRNFPTARGSVVGIIKSCIGLCGGLYSIVFYQGWCGGDAARFLRFLGYGPSLVVLACVPFVNYVPFVQEGEGWGQEGEDGRRFRIASGLIGVTTAYVLVVSLVGGGSGGSGGSGHLQGVFAVGALLLLVPMLSIVYDSGGLFATREVEDDGEGDGEEARLLAGDGDDGGDDEVDDGEDDDDDDDDDDLDGTTDLRSMMSPSHALTPVRAPAIVLSLSVIMDYISPSLTLAECWADANFYILASVTGIGIAAGLSFLNNSPQLVGAWGGSDAEKTVVVAFFSCASCMGRLLFGAVSEHAMQVHRVSRVVFLIIAAVAATCVYLSLSFESLASPGMLYPLSLLSGLTFGGHWACLPSLASELFGLRSFASIYSVLQLSPGVGAYVLGAYVGGRYDAVGKAHGDASGCVGADCFASSFRTIAMLSGLGVAGAIVLWRRTTGMYAGLVGRLLEVER